MGVLEFLIPLALLLGVGGLVFFIWTITAGQYDDLDGAAQRILIDEDFPLPDEPKAKDQPLKGPKAET